jgi:hypothetical protein
LNESSRLVLILGYAIPEAPGDEGRTNFSKDVLRRCSGVNGDAGVGGLGEVYCEHLIWPRCDSTHSSFVQRENLIIPPGTRPGSFPLRV